MRHLRSYHAVHPSGTAMMPSSAHWGQVLLAGAGSLRLRHELAVWTVDRDRAAWVPAGARVTVHTRGRTAVRSLYLPAELDLLPADLRVITATPLLRAVLVALTTNVPVSPDEPRAEHLLAVLADELHDQPADEDVGAEKLLLPTDSRALRVAERVLADPGVALDAAIQGCGASRRTVERLFLAETSIGPAAWQRRARVQELVSLRSEGRTVTECAGLLGYATPSALSAMVTAERRASGATRRTSGATRRRSKTSGS